MGKLMRNFNQGHIYEYPVRTFLAKCEIRHRYTAKQKVGNGEIEMDSYLMMQSENIYLQIVILKLL